MFSLPMCMSNGLLSHSRHLLAMPDTDNLHSNRKKRAYGQIQNLYFVHWTVTPVGSVCRSLFNDEVVCTSLTRGIVFEPVVKYYMTIENVSLWRYSLPFYLDGVGRIISTLAYHGLFFGADHFLTREWVSFSKHHSVFACRKLLSSEGAIEDKAHTIFGCPNPVTKAATAYVKTTSKTRTFLGGITTVSASRN